MKTRIVAFRVVTPCSLVNVSEEHSTSEDRGSISLRNVVNQHLCCRKCAPNFIEFRSVVVSIVIHKDGGNSQYQFILCILWGKLRAVILLKESKHAAHRGVLPGSY
jgi:hypothetical protein